MHKKIVITALICLLAFCCCKGWYSNKKTKNDRIQNGSGLTEQEKTERQIELTKFDHRPLLKDEGTTVYIPEINITAPVQWANASYETKEEMQAKEDAANQGIIFTIYRNAVITDHADECFENLPKVKEGMKAYIDTATGDRAELQCIFAGEGKNKNSEITDEYGNKIAKIYQDKIIMYTCQGSDTKHIVLTVWKFCDEEMLRECVPDYEEV